MANDKRQRELKLTARGAEAIAATSVLNAERVSALDEKADAGQSEEPP